MKKQNFLLLSFALLLLNFSEAQTIKMNLQEYASGFVKPVEIIGMPDGRMLVIEQRGSIKVVQADGSVSAGFFMDIQSTVNDNANERGLLGLALDPNFAQNGFFYVNYSKNSTGATQISRFSVDAADPNKGDPTSEFKILEIAQPFSNHNGGCLKFGPDGYLYIGMGDGGSGGDPQQNAQNGQNLLGKMLRIDINQSPYGIPADNPFVNDPNFKDEIWTMGMRNPWRFSFDKLNGDMWIGDVGQNAHEEIDRIPAGKGGLNMGWRCREGFSVGTAGGNCPPDSTFTDPVFDYANPSIGCSVTGGFVYRGAGYPAWNGIYFFADYCSGRFWSVIKNANDDKYTGTQIANLADSQTTSFGEDNNGRLYTTGHLAGKIYKLCSTFTVSGAGTNETCPGAADGAISLTINDLQGTPSFKWSNGATTESLSNVPAGSYTVTVSDGEQCTVKSTVTVSSATVAVPVFTVSSDFLLTINSGFSAPFQWFLNGTAIAGANSETYLATQTGEYKISAVDPVSGCPTVSAPFFVNTVSTELPASVEKFEISPNPFDSNLQINLELSSKQMVKLRLVDAAGRTVWEKKARTNRISETLNLGEKAAGTYFLKVELPGGNFMRQVIKN